MLPHTSFQQHRRAHACMLLMIGPMGRLPSPAAHVLFHGPACLTRLHLLQLTLHGQHQHLPHPCASLSCYAGHGRTARCCTTHTTPSVALPASQHCTYHSYCCMVISTCPTLVCFSCRAGNGTALHQPMGRLTSAVPPCNTTTHTQTSQMACLMSCRQWHGS